MEAAGEGLTSVSIVGTGVLALSGVQLASIKMPAQQIMANGFTLLARIAVSFL